MRNDREPQTLKMKRIRIRVVIAFIFFQLEQILPIIEADVGKKEADALYVRAYNGQNSRWYRAARLTVEDGSRWHGK